jgi:hypothetical protein
MWPRPPSLAPRQVVGQFGHSRGLHAAPNPAGEGPKGEIGQKRRHGVVEDEAAGALQRGAQGRLRVLEAASIELVDEEVGRGDRDCRNSFRAIA